jgi:p-hydroxybenzoate 3-monooxygenase
LVLGALLQRAGIESVILEARSRDYVERRIRAGVLEQGTVELLGSLGVDARLHREGIRHEGLELRFDRRGHRIALSELTGGRAITIYGQQEVIKDLIDDRQRNDAPLRFETAAVRLLQLDTERPRIRFRGGSAGADGEEEELECDFVAGCDGFHGVCRESVPDGVLTRYEHSYPYAWLGILAEVPPSTEELIYCHHERGFALHSLRSPKLSRLYLQCDLEDRIEGWSDERIWQELHTRFATEDDWQLGEGPIIEKAITPMRSFAVAPMQHGRLFLAGDAAHIVPPTGAKGLNLAVHDVRALAEAMIAWFQTGRGDLLAAYSDTCLRRVWRVQHFSAWMTAMLHRSVSADAFDLQLQRAQLEYVTRSRAAATTLAENYVGLERI